MNHTPGVIYTVGHSTCTEQELLAILRDAGVRTIVDVRRFPSSRRHPQFNSGELAVWLPAAGVEYVHAAALGGRRDPLPNSVNAGWRERAFQGYADHLQSNEFAAGLTRLEELARGRPTAIMCAEAVWWRCHRRLIADVLVVRGWRVEHLGVGAEHAIHRLPGFAVVERGLPHYPPAQPPLFPG